MTLTISQLQNMYGATAHELKGRNAPPAGQKAVTNTPQTQEVIPAEDNPLFMSVAQRADAARAAQNSAQHATQDAKDREEPVIPEFDWKYGRDLLEYMDDTSELRTLRNMTPDERVTYQRNKRAQQTKEDAIAAILPPRPAGALGKDLRLNMVDIEKATFLEDMKIKYSEYKDAIRQRASDGKSEQWHQEMVGNSFVNHFDHYFSVILHNKESMDRNMAEAQRYQSRGTEDRNSSERSNDTWAQKMHEEQAEFNRRFVEPTATSLLQWATENNATEAMTGYFADYSEFVTGKRLNLNMLSSNFTAT